MAVHPGSPTSYPNPGKRSSLSKKADAGMGRKAKKSTHPSLYGDVMSLDGDVAGGSPEARLVNVYAKGGVSETNRPAMRVFRGRGYANTFLR